MCTLCAVCQNFSLKYFHKRFKIHKIREIKDPRKFSAIQYYITIAQSYTGKYHEFVAVCIVMSAQHE